MPGKCPQIRKPEAGGEVARIGAIDGRDSEMTLGSNEHLHRDLVTLDSSATVPDR